VAAIVPAAFFGAGASLRMTGANPTFGAHSSREQGLFFNRDQLSFRNKRELKRHIPSALMASITLSERTPRSKQFKRFKMR
jgi:hypothetical protein